MRLFIGLHVGARDGQERAMGRREGWAGESDGWGEGYGQERRMGRRGMCRIEG